MSGGFDRKRYYRQRRSKNLAVLFILLGLATLFFAVTVVKMRAVEERRHETSPAVHGTPTAPNPINSTPSDDRSGQ